MRVSISRQIGSVLMIIGTEIGAGILALPIMIAHFGFILGSVFMLLVWSLMTYTTFMVCDINLAMEQGTSFAEMARKLFGKFGQVVVWVSFLFLLYVISFAYISAAGSAFSTIFHIKDYLASLIFVAFLGGFVVFGTSSVDWVNRILLITKLALLLFVCLFLVPHSNFDNLAVFPVTEFKYYMALFPILVTAFVGHIIIPSVRSYVNSDVKVLRRVIWIGCLIPLAVYVIWLIAIIGNIPFSGANSFQDLFALGDNANVGNILDLIKANLNKDYFVTPLSAFTSISVSTSFLAVSLSLKDFLIDGIKLNKHSAFNRTVVVIMLVFAIPLMVVVVFPNIFIKALAFVGLCCTILLVILPVLMIRKLKLTNHKFNFYGMASPILNTLALLAGIILISLELASNFV